MKTPDHVINPMYPCSCTIKFDGKAEKHRIVFCPTHAIAHEMATMLRGLVNRSTDGTIFYQMIVEADSLLNRIKP